MSATLPTETKVWTLQHSPETNVVLGNNADSTFKIEVQPLPALTEGDVLIEVIYLSNDPAQRAWIGKIDPKRLYTEPVNQGDVMRSGALSKVLASKSTTINVGDFVFNLPGWRQYGVFKDTTLRRITPIPGFPVIEFLGTFGINGLTAWVGLFEVAKATKDDHTIVVSGAAGATGQAVVQIAKHVLGCQRVIGIAGSADKCKLVKSLGADECVDYKSPSFKEDLIKHTDGFVDVYFDNVGGEILDLLLSRMKRHGRIAACGAISSYNSTAPTVLKHYMQVISNRISILGFIASDSAERFPAAVAELAKWTSEGKIKVGEGVSTHTVDLSSAGGFERIPDIWNGLFSGHNTGKLVTKLAIV